MDLILAGCEIQVVNRADAIDGEEKTLKTHDRKDSLKKIGD